MPGYDHKEATLKAFTLDAPLIKYRACKTGTVTANVTPITATTDVVKGFAIDDGVAGENRAIAIEGGIIQAEAGAAIAADADLMIDSVGRVITWTASAGTNVPCVGKALEAATASGDVIPMQFVRFTKQG